MGTGEVVMTTMLRDQARSDRRQHGLPAWRKGRCVSRATPLWRPATASVAATSAGRPDDSPSSSASSCRRAFASASACACSTSSICASTFVPVSSAMPCALGETSVDLPLHLREGRHVVADGRLELRHRRVHLLVHLRLVELVDSSFSRSSSFCCKRVEFWLTASLAFSAALVVSSTSSSDPRPGLRG